MYNPCEVIKKWRYQKQNGLGMIGITQSVKRYRLDREKKLLRKSAPLPPPPVRAYKDISCRPYGSGWRETQTGRDDIAADGAGRGARSFFALRWGGKAKSEGRTAGQVGDGRALGCWVLPSRGGAAGAGAAQGLARVQEKKSGMRWKFFEGWGRKNEEKIAAGCRFFVARWNGAKRKTTMETSCCGGTEKGSPAGVTGRRGKIKVEFDLFRAGGFQVYRRGRGRGDGNNEVLHGEGAGACAGDR